MMSMSSNVYRLCLLLLGALVVVACIALADLDGTASTRLATGYLSFVLLIARRPKRPGAVGPSQLELSYSDEPPPPSRPPMRPLERLIASGFVFTLAEALSQTVT